MRKLIIGLSLSIAFVTSAMAQTKDAIVGKWKSEHGSGHIQIYSRSDKLFGKLVWIKEPNDEKGKPKVDINNPDPKLRKQPIVGLELLKDFVYDGKGSWEDGTVYDPKSGKKYSCKMALKGDDKLEMRGYMGISLLGRTETWTRVK